jgi:quercetin dioxygenase-like cupin family protein
MDPRLYYDYEGRFIKQTLERDRVRLLPRVVVPERFATGGHALGDPRVFERFTAGPISMFTCRFIELAPGQSTALERRIPSMSAFVLEGSGICVQENVEHAFGTEDVLFVPPYTTFRIVAGDAGARLWVPETRLWHVLGLLWHEHFEPQHLTGDAEPIYAESGDWAGYQVSRGVLGLDRDVLLAAGEDRRRAAVFAARRGSADAARHSDPVVGRTGYDTFLSLLNIDRDREKNSPRVIAKATRPLEDTRQGRLRFYIDNWSGLAGQDLDMAAYEIPAGMSSGRHRHVAEELLLVLQGQGHDVHDGTSHGWKAGDLICIPPMTEHQHFASDDGPARLISVWSRQPANEFMGGIEHVEDASTWTAR